MHTFAQKPKVAQQNASAKPTTSCRSYSGLAREVDSSDKRSSATAEVARFGRDFSRIPVYETTLVRLQSKLTVNVPGDIYDQEADRVADQVMRMPEPQPQHICPCDGCCPRCQNEQTAYKHLQSNSAQENDIGDSTVPTVVHDVISSPGHPLEPITRGFMESCFGHDFSRVRVHTDAQAEESARVVGARAYTVGLEVVFGARQYRPSTTEGRRLLAHELTHVVQQCRFAAPSSARVHSVSLPQKAETERTAETVLRGEGLLPIQQTSAPVLAMEREETDTTSGTIARVLEALNRPDPIAGVGNPSEALAILRGLSGEELVATVIEVDDRFLLGMLLDAIGMTDQTEVGAVIYAVRFTTPHGASDDRYGIQAARGLGQLPIDEQDRILARVLARRGVGVSIAQVREGMQALEESEATLTTEDYEEVTDASTSPAALIAGVAMGPWNPGGMPIPFYIGNSAHIAIAAEYAALHRADAAFYNFSPVSSILAAAAALGLTVNPVALGAAQLGLKPDIANLTRRHLYEIKPAGSQSLAAAEARLYMAAFTAAGLPLVLGPISERGTSGTVPAPGGWYVFTSPEAGVITYRYRQPRRRRVRAPQPQTSSAVDRSLVERIQTATGLTGAALVIYIIISEGSRVAFPPRNLVPVP